MPGRPPTRLVARPHAPPRFAPDPWESATEDPVAGQRLGDSARVHTRMSATPPDGWYAAGTLILTGPSRTAAPGTPVSGQEVLVRADGRVVLVDEEPLRFRAIRVRRHSLDPPAKDIPLLSHLRALHVRTLGRSAVPRASDWYPVSGIDGCSTGSAGPPTGRCAPSSCRPRMGLRTGWWSWDPGRRAGRRSCTTWVFRWLPMSGSTVRTRLGSPGAPRKGSP